MNNSRFKGDKLINDSLLSAASQFDGKNAVNSFIQQVLTENERLVIGRRIAIARLILAGMTYYEVCEKLQISPNTFRNIRQWVGKELPAYKNVLDVQKELKVKKDRAKYKKINPRITPFTFADLKRRYPMHFLLFNIADELLKLKGNKNVARKKKPK